MYKRKLTKKKKKNIFLQHSTDLGGVLHRFTRQLVPKNRLHHLSTPGSQNRQQTVTQAMRFLVAPLQPDTRLSADFSGIQLHSVIPAGRPFADWPQVGDVSEDIFVRITLVARCHHEGIHFQTLLALERRVVLLGRVDVDAHAVFGAVVLHARDLAGWQNPVLPLLLVGVLHALQVEVVVDLLDQLETDNAVVGGTVCGKRALALFGGQVVEFLNPFWVKYFIHTGIISMPLNQLRWGGEEFTMASHHWDAWPSLS